MMGKHAIKTLDEVQQALGEQIREINNTILDLQETTAPPPIVDLIISENITSQLQRHPSERYAIRPLSAIKKIVVHHVAGTMTASQIAQMHVQEKGWPGIGYHFYINKIGRVFVTNHLTTRSYHAKGSNTDSIGICLDGSLDKNPASPEQINALIHTINSINFLLGKDLQLLMHKEVTNTDCPGKAFEDKQWPYVRLKTGYIMSYVELKDQEIL